MFPIFGSECSLYLEHGALYTWDLVLPLLEVGASFTWK